MTCDFQVAQVAALGSCFGRLIFMLFGATTPPVHTGVSCPRHCRKTSQIVNLAAQTHIHGFEKKECKTRWTLNHKIRQCKEVDGAKSPSLLQMKCRSLT